MDIGTLEKWEKYLCFNMGCFMRTKEKTAERMRKYRFLKELEKRKERREVCVYCGKPVETLHHVDEDHANNRKKNLLSICHKCHLEIAHVCDNQTNPGGYPFKRSRIPQENCYTPSSRKSTPLKTVTDTKPVKILDFLNENPHLQRFTEYNLYHKKGHKWRLEGVSRRTVIFLATLGFKTIGKNTRSF